MLASITNDSRDHALAAAQNAPGWATCVAPQQEQALSSAAAEILRAVGGSRFRARSLVRKRSVMLFSRPSPELSFRQRGGTRDRSVDMTAAR